MLHVVWTPDRGLGLGSRLCTCAPAYMYTNTDPDYMYHSVLGFQFLPSGNEAADCLHGGCVRSAGLNVAMAEKMTAGEYEAHLYSVL